MAKADLIKQAQALGINTEGLTVEQLQGAIANTLSSKKSELEVNVNEAQSKLEALPEDAPEEVKQKATQDFNTAVANLESFNVANSNTGGTGEEEEENAGDENKGEDPEVVQEQAKTSKAKKPQASTKKAETKATKTEETTTAKTVEIDGVTYGFTRKAPERINFLGKNKSQAEWLQDPDAMELLALGNSMYVKPIKN
ncbi:hypothetical protein [Flavobacterium beibuense]|uniref:hypothetical protein n=1 Tax=Flavobacterium beibuense TaxID=657326 RepID=UPI003A92563A